MNRMKKKLRAQSGETLVEALCSVLLVSLSSVLLATMISTAHQLNMTAKQRDDKLYADLSSSEIATPAAPVPLTSQVVVQETLPPPAPLVNANFNVPVQMIGERISPQSLRSYVGS